jgi:hypothetical protein
MGVPWEFLGRKKNSSVTGGDESLDFMLDNYQLTLQMTAASH